MVVLARALEVFMPALRQVQQRPDEDVHCPCGLRLHEDQQPVPGDKPQVVVQVVGQHVFYYCGG